MGDTTWVQFTAYKLPKAKRRRDELASILDGLFYGVNGEIELGEPVAGEASCGSVGSYCAGIVEALGKDAAWELREDPKYEWLGEVAIFTPKLGLFRADCDADGVVQVTDQILRTAYEKVGADARASELMAEISRHTGRAHVEDLMAWQERWSRSRAA